MWPTMLEGTKLAEAIGVVSSFSVCHIRDAEMAGVHAADDPAEGQLAAMLGLRTLDPEKTLVKVF